MLATLPPLPVDRVEPPVRASTSDAAAHAPARERFADLLEKRRNGSDAARQHPADARERCDAQAAALSRSPAKAPSQGTVGASDEVRADDVADLSFELAVDLSESRLPVAGAEAVARRIEAVEDAASNTVPLAMAFGVPAQASDAGSATGTATAPQDPGRSVAARGAAARTTPRMAASAQDDAAQAPVGSAARADAVAPIALAVGTAASEGQHRAPPTSGSEVSATALGPAPSSRPAHTGPVVAAPVVNLPSAPDAQAFGQLLGVQVSLFARDGVQQAELRLNPPETGPIGVQIEIVGNDARVSFHAAQALTREAIERALPELAAALRGEGLTLTGGSVSDRPADAQGDGSAPQARSGMRHVSVPADATRSAPAPQSRPVALGRIDLYA